MFGWHAGAVVRRRRQIAEHYGPGPHRKPKVSEATVAEFNPRQPRDRRGRWTASHGLVYTQDVGAAPMTRETMDAQIRAMGLDPTSGRDSSFGALADTFPFLTETSLDRMAPNTGLLKGKYGDRMKAQRQEAIDTLNDLGRKYPVTATQIRAVTVGHASEPGALAQTNGISELRYTDSVFASPLGFDMHQQMASFAPNLYGAPLTVKYVTAHEYGHAMAFKAEQRSDNPKNWEVAASLVKPNSSYGTTGGPHENLAELFATHYVGGTLTSDQSGLIKAFIKDVEGLAAEAERDHDRPAYLHLVSEARSNDGRGMASVALHGVPRRRPARHLHVAARPSRALPRRSGADLRAGGRPTAGQVAEYSPGQLRDQRGRWSAQLGSRGGEGPALDITQMQMRMTVAKWQSTYTDCRYIQENPDSGHGRAFAAAVESSPRTYGAVYRGFSEYRGKKALSIDEARAVWEKRQGKKVEMNVPTSTSPDLTTATGFGHVTFEVLGGDARDISGLSSIPSFKESILKPGTFGVAGVREGPRVQDPVHLANEPYRTLIVTLVAMP